MGFWINCVRENYNFFFFFSVIYLQDVRSRARLLIRIWNPFYYLYHYCCCCYYCYWWFFSDHRQRVRMPSSHARTRGKLISWRTEFMGIRTMGNSSATRARGGRNSWEGVRPYVQNNIFQRFSTSTAAGIRVVRNGICARSSVVTRSVNRTPQRERLQMKPKREVSDLCCASPCSDSSFFPNVCSALSTATSSVSTYAKCSVGRKCVVRDQPTDSMAVFRENATTTRELDVYSVQQLI